MTPPTPAAPTPSARAALPTPTTRVAREPTQEQRTLVIGRGIRVICNVRDAERIIVEGEFATNMVRATEMSVAQGGTFHGQAEILDAEVAGTIDGTLTVSGKLTVQSTGILLGTTNCARLEVQDGGQITGDVAMGGTQRK